MPPPHSWRASRPGPPDARLSDHRHREPGAGSRPQGLLPEGYSIVARLRGQRPDTSRIEMARAEGWRPHVSSSIATLAEAEHEYLEHGSTVVVGADRAVADKEDQASRAGSWDDADVLVRVRGLSKRFGGIVAAEDLSMTLRRGTIIALVGPNGAGKSTVFNLLTGFIKADRGSVKLNGVQFVGRTPDSVARLGMVRTFQDVRLFQRAWTACRTCRWRCRVSPASGSRRCSSSHGG